MNDNKLNPDNDHFIEVERRAESWQKTALTTIGATLSSALLMWIASNQVQIANNQTSIQKDLKYFSTILDAERSALSEIWPSVRRNRQNILVVKQELEKICDCDIVLSESKDF